jgi:hypothetical protein
MAISLTSDRFRNIKRAAVALAALPVLAWVTHSPGAQAAPPDVYARTLMLVNLSGSNGTASMTLAVPQGSYVVTAKLYAWNVLDDGKTETVRCQLNAGDAEDDSFTTLTDDEYATVVLHLAAVTTDKDKGTITLSCTKSADFGNQVLRKIWITATRVNSVQVQPF